MGIVIELLQIAFTFHTGNFNENSINVFILVEKVNELIKITKRDFNNNK